MARAKDRIGESRVMNNGQEAAIVCYRSATDIDVRFTVGYIAKHVTYSNFKRGGISNPNISLKKQRLGECRFMNNGMKATITRYNKATDLEIKFEDGLVVSCYNYNNFRNGLISHPSVTVAAIKGKKTRQMNAAMHQGEIAYTKSGQRMILSEYRSADDCDVVFDDGTLKCHIQYGSFLVP